MISLRIWPVQHAHPRGGTPRNLRTLVVTRIAWHTATMTHRHITLDPAIAHGKPCIKGTRIPVENVLDLVAQGYTFDEIIARAYPQLNREQLADAVAYANELLQNEAVEPATLE